MLPSQPMAPLNPLVPSLKAMAPLERLVPSKVLKIASKSLASSVHAFFARVPQENSFISNERLIILINLLVVLSLKVSIT